PDDTIKILVEGLGRAKIKNTEEFNNFLNLLPLFPVSFFPILKYLSLSLE
ncbi:unnamed protein product, partial [marine sediment metagenome]